MRYTSTRDRNVSLSSAEAILKGLSNEGGLLVPEALPMLSRKDFLSLAKMQYHEKAAKILSLFLEDFPKETLRAATGQAYGNKWERNNPAPIVKLTSGLYILELWHGPTCAFKDIALQILPRLMSAALNITGEKKDIEILVATSGDTGTAALNGFRDVPRTAIKVFYPKSGVSEIQKLQMVTQEGSNVGVVAVTGNFDDAQAGVKRIFSDKALQDRLSAKNISLSSANSINWGRLVPQIVYYISAYLDLMGSNDIAFGEKVDFAVPTGNFGNILAGYYAREMGLPIGRLICASNRNNVLAQFIETGTYDRNREFFTTTSPSMDILVSSNLERLLYHLSGVDTAAIARYMESLNKTGKFSVSEPVHKALCELFTGGTCDDETAAGIIREFKDKYDYIMDPHTAVAARVSGTVEGVNKTVIVSTASPYKFAGSVLSALKTKAPSDEFERLTALERESSSKAPAALTSLKDKEIRFREETSPNEMVNLI